MVIWTVKDSGIIEQDCKGPAVGVSDVSELAIDDIFPTRMDNKIISKKK